MTTTALRGVERSLARRRQKYEDEVARLREAAFQVMREQDTADPSVNDILAAAGLATSAFYRHFPTKSDLLLTLLQSAHELTRDHLVRRVGAHDDPRDRVTAWVRSMFNLLGTEALVRANRPFLLAHPRLLEQFPQEILAGFDALTAPLAQAITDARRAAGLDVGTAADDARLAMQHVFGILIDRAALRQRSDRRTVDAVVAYTLRAVLPTGP